MDLSNEVVLAWHEDATQKKYDHHEACKKHRDCDFVRTEYRKYMGHAKYQKKMQRNDRFINVLVSGLAQLPALDIVRLDQSWPSFGNYNLPLGRI